VSFNRTAKHNRDMPSFRQVLPIDADPETVFAILDDTSSTPAWLDRCTGIDRIDDGPNEVGTRLRYHYRDPGRTGQMDGRITVRDPNRHLAMEYADRLTDVTIDFRTEPLGTGTRLVHTVEVRPHGLGRLLTPLIAKSLPKQTEGSLANLKRLAESPHGH